MNKNLCYLYSVWINQINESYTSISRALFISKFLAINYLFQTLSWSIKDRLKIKHHLQSVKLIYL